MRQRLRRLTQALRTGFWAVPTACVLLALVLAVGLVELDRALEGLGRVTFGAGPDGAREVLSAITTSMITFTGLVFSITIVVLQLTSSQFSPRVLRTFLRDRQTQLSLGVFVATFVYAVMVLRTIDSTEGNVFVPAVATTVGVVLLLLSVGVFVGYIHHIATAIQVSSLIRAVGDETRATIERRLGGDEHPRTRLPPTLPRRPPRRLSSPGYGVVVQVDEQPLVELARAAGVVLVLRAELGQFVPEGAPLLDVHGDGELDERAAVRAVHLAKDRTMDHDVAFGIRQLVDVAERALSPGINDPTTAVQALDELHDLLRRLATRRLPDGVHRDEDDHVRLVTPAPRFADFLTLALDEVEQYGSDSTQVQARIDTLLRDLEQAALPEHRAAVLAAQRRRPLTVASPQAGQGWPRDEEVQ